MPRNVSFKLCIFAGFLTVALLWPTYTPVAAGNQGQEAGERPVVVLVHGWGGSCNSMADVKSYLEAKKYFAVCFDPDGDGKSGYLEKRGVLDSALDLSLFITEEKGRQGMSVSAPNVDIVAHSFGGLVARYYVEELNAGQPVVRRLVMLGTPNGGLIKAALFSWGLRLWPLGKPDLSLRDMGINSDVLKTLNNNPVHPGTAYQVYAGNASKSILYPPDQERTLANDCIVRTSSASGPGLPTEEVDATHTTGLVKLVCPEHFLLGTPGLLSPKSPALPLMKDFLQEDTGTGLVVPTTQQVSAASITADLPDNDASVAEPHELEGASILDTAAGTLAPLAVVSTDVKVTATDHAIFFLTWQGSEAMDFRLRGPDGVLVAPTDPKVKYVDVGEVEESGLSAIHYSVSSPIEGTWFVELEGTGLTAPSAYSVVVIGDGALGLVFDVESQVVELGAPVILTASFGESRPVMSATVKAEVRGPDGETTSLPLVDDGSGADAMSNDGVHTATLARTFLCGQYYATAAATEVSGTEFSRESALVFTMVVPGDGAGDPCLPDDDGDGVPDADELKLGSHPLDSASLPENRSFNATACSDGVDNDKDGLFDQSDQGCGPRAALFDFGRLPVWACVLDIVFLVVWLIVATMAPFLALRRKDGTREREPGAAAAGELLMMTVAASVLLAAIGIFLGTQLGEERLAPEVLTQVTLAAFFLVGSLSTASARAIIRTLGPGLQVRPYRSQFDYWLITLSAMQSTSLVTGALLFVLAFLLL